jgi:hypothetical protein
MADSKGTLILRDYLPQNLSTEKALAAFLAQIEKDLQINLASRKPHEVFNETRVCLENRASSGEMMPLLYRVDLDEDIAAAYLVQGDWQGLTGAVLKRIAGKLSWRFSRKDQK